MILREMPPIWDSSYRAGFYARWGFESSVISATTRCVEYPEFSQVLSIKMMSGGEEDYFVDGQRIAVDDDTYLILNAGRRYASRITSIQPVRSFSLFFRPGLAEQVLDGMARSVSSMLDDPGVARARPMEFSEHLREHDRSVTPVLRFIQGVVDRGEAEPVWLEEQLHFLLHRMLRSEHNHCRVQERVPSVKITTRRELLRRLALGATYLHTHYREAIGLPQIASAAHMSSFHFLRTFKAVYGVTPSIYLSRKRTQAALRLIRTCEWSLNEIAEHVGFGSRTTLFRRLKAHTGATSNAFRSAGTRPESRQQEERTDGAVASMLHD